MITVFNRLKSALSKTANKIAAFRSIFTQRNIDISSLNELEEILLTNDFGVKTTSLIIQQIERRKFDKNSTFNDFQSALSEILIDILQPVEKPLLLDPSILNIILLCGVNGNGKTTSIGKLAAFFQQQGQKVYLAGCDTYRAAATKQLQIWGEKLNCKVISAEGSADPASVAYKAVSIAQQEKANLLIIDTAGRLQNQQNLMQELMKIINVIKKVNANTLQEVILTLDATTGQNVFSQLEKFKENAEITGLIITKLDGTAKGGGIVGLANNYNIPIYFVGVGERVEDLIPFNAREYVSGILD